MLAEATTTELSKEHKPDTFSENIEIAKRGGSIAGDARKAIERDTGKPVITKKNSVDFAKLIEEIGEESKN